MTDDITLVDLWQILLNRYKLVIGGTLLGTALACLIAFTSQPVYRAEALLAPVSADQRSDGLPALAHQLGDIAGLAGLSFSSGNERRVEALAVLQSRALTEAFVAEADLLPVLFPDKWDASRGKWKADLRGKVPTLWDANELFASKLRKVSENRETGLVTLAIEWTDPKLAARWVAELIARTNDRLRTRAISDSERHIAYLRRQLQTVDAIEIRQSIYRLIESEIKTIMLAQGNDEYAFKVIDPPVVPQEHVRPKRVLIIGVGVVSGFTLSCIAALFLGRRPRS